MTRRHLIVLAFLVLAASGPSRAQDASARAGRFTFREGASRHMPVTLADRDGATTFVWPASDAEWDTAILAVQVSADPLIPSPYIEISAGSVDRQYFAQGDAGERWVNLSFLRGVVAPGSQVTIRANGATLAAGDASLRLFAATPELAKSVLVLSPHPDDAEIAAFGIYANRRSTVVTVTAGNAGAPTYESVFEDLAELYLFKGRIRLIDSVTVPWQGGVPPERAFNLGYFDARLGEMYDKRGAVVPEMYRPNSDINVYRQGNIG